MKKASRPFRSGSMAERVFFLLSDLGEAYGEDFFRKLGMKDKREKDAVYMALARMKGRGFITITRFGTYKLTKKGKDTHARLKKE